MDNEKAIKILRKGYPDINRYAASELEAYEYNVETYNEAVGYAISHLEEERWIPITERAPKEYGNYFVTIEYVDERIITITKYSQHGWFLEGVTAWRELPKPYESEAENER